MSSYRQKAWQSEKLGDNGKTSLIRTLHSWCDVLLLIRPSYVNKHTNTHTRQTQYIRSVINCVYEHCSPTHTHETKTVVLCVSGRYVEEVWLYGFTTRLSLSGRMQAHTHTHNAHARKRKRRFSRATATAVCSYQTVRRTHTLHEPVFVPCSTDVVDCTDNCQRECATSITSLPSRAVLSLSERTFWVSMRARHDSVVVVVVVRCVRSQCGFPFWCVASR